MKNELNWYLVNFVVPGTDGDAENGPCEPDGWEDMILAPDEQMAIYLANEQAVREYMANPFGCAEAMDSQCPVCVSAKMVTETERQLWLQNQQFADLSI